MIPLPDILNSARQESYRMRHYFLGVEHLLIALLEIKGGIAGHLLEEQGFTPEYVINAIRLKLGKGGKQRQWSNVPTTPRAELILNMAAKTGRDKGQDEVDERDLLIAILSERDSIAVRAIHALGLDIEVLAVSAHHHTSTKDSHWSYIRIEYSDDVPPALLTKSHMLILRRMFNGYSRVRVERRLTGGYSKALLLVVTPIQADHRHDATVVVKIDRTAIILDEAQRYEQHVKNSLPAMTARLQDKPTVLETSDLAGLKYSLVADHDHATHDLRAMIHQWDAQELSRWLRESLYSTFAPLWWKQSRAYRFPAWREYDWILPPVLTLELVPERHIPQDAFIMRFPVKRQRLSQVEFGDIVVVENFVVRKLDYERNTIQLAVGMTTAAEMAYKIEVRGLDLSKDTFYRGEVIEKIAGRVWQTRNQQLVHEARALEPDFDLMQEFIPTGEVKLPNPLLNYENHLDTMINGQLSKIHGDMHLGNIMVGPNNSAFLIDFAHARDGHTIFDWVSLEISILSDLVMPKAGQEWEDARQVIGYLELLNTGKLQMDEPSAIVQALQPIVALRQIVEQCLATPDNWSEYYTALALCALRALTWNTMSVPGRRLMLMVSALAMHELRERPWPGGRESETPSPDETDVNTAI